MPICTQTCELEPFRSQVTPQADDPSSLELFQSQIEEYLTRFREAVCADATCLNIYSSQDPILVVEAEVDFPSVGSKGSTSLDLPVAAKLGTHIISFAALTDATSIDDLMIQFLVVADNIVRITLQNPTAGVIDPDPITFQFILGAPA